jgi:ribosomal protein S27AE
MHLRTRDPNYTSARLTTECAQCGEPLFLPEWSEYLDERHLRHLWACATCGYQFETTVRFREAA